MASAAVFPQERAFAERTRSKIYRRLVPFLLLLYTIAYLDRVNLSYASLQMTRELHFTGEVYGFGAGIFFLGYWFLEVPGAVLVERWSARKWISRIMVSWGLIAAATGFIHTQPEFYWARFLLGVAEAGFFPGIAVYLTHWFSAADRAKAVSGLFIGIPISQIIGAPISAVLLRIHWLGWSGWRWLLLIEGAPAILCGILVLFYLPDRPADARWLTLDERNWITAQIEEQKSALRSRTGKNTLLAVWHSGVLTLTGVWFLYLCSALGLTLWLPKMVQSMSGYSPVATTLLSAIPYWVALPFALFVGWNSDRTGERRWHAALCLLLAAGGLGLSRIAGNVPVAICAFTAAAMGLIACQAPFWSVTTSVLTGTSSAVLIGLINSFGQIGGFTGPYIMGFLTDRTGSYAAGTLYLIGCAVGAAVLGLFIRLPPSPHR